jgi:hypothetical protein
LTCRFTHESRADGYIGEISLFTAPQSPHLATRYERFVLLLPLARKSGVGK